MRVISRAEWGARHDNGFGPRALPAREVWLHHSVTIAPDLVQPFDDDYAAIRALEDIGESRFGRGVSYTRLITPVGLIFEGHGIDRVGSHTANHNTVACGYCLVGNYEDNTPTDEQLVAVVWLLRHDHANGWIRTPRVNGGHRDLKATACPGQHAYDAIPTINARAAAEPITDPPSAEPEEVVDVSDEKLFYAKGDADPGVYLVKVQFDNVEQPLVRRHVKPTEFAIVIGAGAKLAIIGQAEFNAIPKIDGSM